MDDDLYPNSGDYFMPREPVDQSIARKKEKAQTLEALNAIKDMIVRLEERIIYYESNSSIPDEVRTEPDKFLIMHNAHTLTARTLQSEKEYLEGLLDMHKR